MKITGDNKCRGEQAQSLCVSPLYHWLCTEKNTFEKKDLWVRRQLRNRVYSSSAQRRIWVDAAGSTAIPEPVKEEEDRGCDTMIILS